MKKRIIFTIFTCSIFLGCRLNTHKSTLVHARSKTEAIKIKSFITNYEVIPLRKQKNLKMDVWLENGWIEEGFINPQVRYLDFYNLFVLLEEDIKEKKQTAYIMVKTKNHSEWFRSGYFGYNVGNFFSIPNDLNMDSISMKVCLYNSLDTCSYLLVKPLVSGLPKE